MKNRLKYALTIIHLFVVMGCIYKFNGIEWVAILTSAFIIAELWQINGKL